jgi:hypothetical protein
MISVLVSWLEHQQFFHFYSLFEAPRDIFPTFSHRFPLDFHHIFPWIFPCDFFGWFYAPPRHREAADLALEELPKLPEPPTSEETGHGSSVYSSDMMGFLMEIMEMIGN